VQALEEEFPDLEQELRSLSSGVTPSEPGGGGGATLDLRSLLKAAESISSEIVLEQLLERLMELSLATAGAERCVLVVEEEGRPTIRAVGSVSAPPSLEPTPLERSRQVPRTLIEQVRRTAEPVVLHDAANRGAFAADPYIAEHGVRSVLALPIVRLAKMLGILYLENNLTTDVFNVNRVKVLQLLSSHIATSLENARLYREAREAVALRDEFLRVASHELRTPLASLLPSLQWLDKRCAQGQGPVPAAFAKQVHNNLRQGRRLNRLVDELFDTTQIESGQLELKQSEVDLAELVRDVINRFDFELRRSNCEVRFEAPTQVRGWWDSSRLDQVVSNLLANAIKFAPGHPIEIVVTQEDAHAMLSLTDHGIGIDPARVGNIFDRFVRGVSASHYGGLGLGLFISRQIVERHGGTISVHSQLGAGSTFTVQLPISGSALDWSGTYPPLGA
jgi:signal transduction histidine kinase